MGLRQDRERFQEIGESQREDLEEYIKHGNIGGNGIKIPIKIVDLPEFEYSPFDKGGIGQGDGEQGDPVDAEPQDGDDGDEAGDDSAEHGHYEMDPEEFAEELDDVLDLDLDPKGKHVEEEVEGDYTDMSRTGPNSTLDMETMVKRGIKRKIAFDFDEEYLREVMRVEGMGPQRVFEWARSNNVPVSRDWIEEEYATLTEKGKYSDINEISKDRQQQIRVGKGDIPIRKEDERYRYPETVEKKQKNVVVVNIRDVSGSMGDTKRELVERVFTPMDWYLTGKYDTAEFIYIAHDAEAWEVDRDEFFGIRSGGGTKISSAYKLAQQLLDERYPWSEWNRYVFAAGDGENTRGDSEEEVVPLMEEIDANLHAYLQVGATMNAFAADHAEIVDNEIGNNDNVSVAKVQNKEDVMDAIKKILSEEDN